MALSLSFCFDILAPVVQTLDSAIHWINHCPLDNSIDFASVYPLDSDLSGAQRYPYASFEQLGPGARFSKVPKLFGRISGDLILFVSSKRRGLEARNFAIIISIFILLTTYEKNSFTELAGRSFTNGFSDPKSFSRNGPLAFLKCKWREP